MGRVEGILETAWENRDVEVASGREVKETVFFLEFDLVLEEELELVLHLGLRLDKVRIWSG